MKKETVLLLIESGLLVGVLSLAFWVGAQANTIQAHDKSISKLQDEHQSLAKDLVETQKEIIRRLTRIETLMDK